MEEAKVDSFKLLLGCLRALLSDPVQIDLLQAFQTPSHECEAKPPSALLEANLDLHLDQILSFQHPLDNR